VAKAPGILIIVENLTLPLDRRVWTEARALRDAGYTVSIVCPKGSIYTAPYELLEGIHIFRHPMPYEADGALGYAFEYSWALAWEFALSIKAYFKVGFDVVQACNPPDLLFVIGAFWKYLFGKRFVFDHHDINPELFEVKFGKKGPLHSLMIWLERLTFKTADVSIAINETFRDIAITRGGMDPDRVFIVRSVPDLTRFKRVAPNLDLKNGRKFVAGYVGIMGAQDGVDLLIEAMDELVNRQECRDVQCVIVGSGTELPNLQRMTSEMGLEDYITFTGFLSIERMLQALSTFDIGIIPDPKNVFNDKISMNKVFEYMSLGIPFVSFDLVECGKDSGAAAIHAANNDSKDLARQMRRLCDDADLRAALSDVGLARAKALLRWEAEKSRLLAAYDMALSDDGEVLPRPVAATRLAATK
jgi:glycosyltransferase involved in cell wall biosynthesis